jgi:hypothetical protein
MVAGVVVVSLAKGVVSLVFASSVAFVVLDVDALKAKDEPIKRFIVAIIASGSLFSAVNILLKDASFIGIPKRSVILVLLDNELSYKTGIMASASVLVNPSVLPILFTYKSHSINNNIKNATIGINIINVLENFII